MHKVILIDTSTLLFPAVFSWERQMIQKLESKSDIFVMPPHAVYFSSLLSCLKKIGINKDDIVILATEGRSWRKSVAGYYKSQRETDRKKHKLIDWDYQFKKLNEVNEKMDKATDWHVVREWNSEADDIIAVACRFYNNKDVVVVTADKDIHQLTFYKNVYIFNVNKKCNGSKGMFEKIDNPLKIIADKVRMGDISDNIIVNKENDTKLDELLRYEIINLLKLPDYIENAIIDILKNLPNKELNLNELPNFKNAKEKFLKIYKKDKVITPEYCYQLIEKREEKKKNKAKRKREEEKLEKTKEKFKRRTYQSLTEKEWKKLDKDSFLHIIFPEAPEYYEDLKKEKENGRK